MRCLFVTLAALTVFLLPAPAPEPGPKVNLAVVEGEGRSTTSHLVLHASPLRKLTRRTTNLSLPATVVFLLPNDGAGGAFPDGAQTLTTRTNGSGRAVARGFYPNKIQGKFEN